MDRPRLLRRLDERPPLLLLRAPTGFGKTTLAAQWAARQDPEDTTTVWLRARSGAGEDASSVFWSDTLRALRAAGLRLDTETEPGAYGTGALARVELKLQLARQPVVMVIDGLDNIAATDLDVDLLDLLRHAPRLQLVVCLRGHQHFPTHRHLDLDTDVLTARDLRFTEPETAGLLTAAGVNLPADRIRALHEESGGWPEPTRAVALRLRAEPQLAEVRVSDVVDKIAVDYLRERLLSTEPTDRVEFALATALPDGFTIELAELLTDGGSVTSHLEGLVGAGVLTTTVRNGEVVYRWPAAARRALAGELHSRWPERELELHRRLARWHRSKDEVGDALRHAVAAEDWAVVLALLEASWRRLVMKYDDEMTRAFVALPPEFARHSPRIIALRAAVLRAADDALLGIAVLPADPEELRELGHRDDVAGLLDTAFAITIALRYRGTYELAATYGARALEIARAARARQPTRILDLYPVLHLHVGIAQLLRGDIGSAIGTLRHTHDRSETDTVGHVASDSAGKLALAHAVSGDVDEAALWLRRHGPAEQLPDISFRPMIESTGTVAGLLIALDRLEIDEATVHHRALTAHLRRDESWAFITYARAQLALQLGTAADALAAVDRDRNRYPEWLTSDSLARPMLAGVDADLLLALGRGNQARAVLAGPDAAHPWLQVPRARLALLTGHPDVAAGLARDTTWERSATARQRMEMQLINAVAAERLGKGAVAERALRRAVDAARASGALRPFTLVPRAELLTVAERVPAAADLLATTALAAHPDIFPTRLTLVELTEREQHVLAGLTEGLTVREIADTAVLSFNTVRTQKRSLYKKLGTSVRSEAITRAREWGLLPGRRPAS